MKKHDDERYYQWLVNGPQRLSWNLIYRGF